jgi:hypothetical protein
VSDLPKLEATITVPVGGWTISITEDPAKSATVTVPAGDYKLTGTGGLLAVLVAALTADGTLDGTYAGSCSDDSDTASTGKITISVTGVTTYSVTACAAGLQAALGFSSWGTPSASKTGQLSSPYIFLPGCRREPGLCPDGDIGMPVTDGTFTIAPSGATRVLCYGERYEDVLAFGHLTGAKTWKAIGTTDPNATLQSFFELAIMLGLPIHYHPDRSVDTTYVSYVSSTVGRLPAEPVVPTWTTGANSLWSVRFDVVRYALADYVA